MKRKDFLLGIMVPMIMICIYVLCEPTDINEYKEPAIIPHPCIYVDGQEICQGDENHTLDMICDIDKHPNERFIWSRDQQNIDSSMVLIYQSPVEYIYREHLPDGTMGEKHICVKALHYFE